MTDLPFEQLAYEFHEIWDKEWFPAEDHERIRKLAELVPRSTKSLLDLGCGNGLFLNYLQAEHAQHYSRLTGIDRSNAALAHVKTEKRQASIDALPFSDAEFDTVTCHEVLEHLPLPVYAKAISEIARVAKCFIVTCVPYKQNLAASLSKCPSCLARFNADFHVRSYDERNLGPLFSVHGFDRTAMHYLGGYTVRYDQEFRATLRALFRNEAESYPSYAVCPVCGFTDREKLIQDLMRRKQAGAAQYSTLPLERRRSQLRKLIASMLPTRTAYRWIAAIYARQAQLDDRFHETTQLDL